MCIVCLCMYVSLFSSEAPPLFESPRSVFCHPLTHASSAPLPTITHIPYPHPPTLHTPITTLLPPPQVPLDKLVPGESVDAEFSLVDTHTGSIRIRMLFNSFQRKNKVCGYMCIYVSINVCMCV